MYKKNTLKSRWPNGRFSLILRTMKATILILTTAILYVHAAAFSQNVTLHQNNITLKQLFGAIRTQTGYDVLYRSNELNDEQLINANFMTTPLKDVLNKSLDLKRFQYTVDEKTIVIRSKVISITQAMPQTTGGISGKVVFSSSGEPISGVTIVIIETGKGTSTDANGNYSFTGIKPGTYHLRFSYLTTVKKELPDVAVVAGQVTVLNTKLDEAANTLTEVSVGARGGVSRTAFSSPVPVDVISIDNMDNTTGRTNVLDQLNYAVPSFNYNKQSGSDVADAVDLANLRGLGYDQTLVLVDGKRRYTSANVITGGFRGRGNSGTDLGAIPAAAIDRIEVLRDGASAQYGSDALGGVINIILKKNVNHFRVSVDGSGYYDHKYNTLNSVDPTLYATSSKFDGKTLNLSMDYGIPIGTKGGFLNVGATYRSVGATYRAEPDTNYSVNKNAVVPASLVRRAAGDGSVKSGGAMYNLEIPLDNAKTKFYSFGGFNKKESFAYANTRFWSNGQTKFPTDGNNQLIFVPGIMHVYTPTPGVALDTAHVMYSPGEQVYINDYSASVGIKGATSGDWKWDLSSTTGYNSFHTWGDKTFNTSLPQPLQTTKTRFDDGSYSFLQSTQNFDITKFFKGFGRHGLTFSSGLEYRYEQYKINKGDSLSYITGPAKYKGAAKAGGAQGYPGNQPGDEANAHRSNVAAYWQLSSDITEKWLVELAERVEHYSDFGFVNTGKLATRYLLTDFLSLRGSVSSGFRAPSLQQLNYSNTNTTVTYLNDGSRTFANTRFVPNSSVLARLAGIPKLKQETSVNESFGFALNLDKDFTFTADAYNISIKNRIVFSGQYAVASSALAAPLKNEMVAEGISKAIFFANALNSTNRGIDIVADYHTHIGKDRISAIFAGNFQETLIKAINIPKGLKNSAADSANFYNVREQSLLKATAPPMKLMFNLEYATNKFSVGSRLTWFGKESIYGNRITGVAMDNGTIVPEIYKYRAKGTTDLYASYKFGKFAKLAFGVDNIFNVHPDKTMIYGSKASMGDSESGGIFDAMQMGFNGMQLWTKLTFDL